MLFSMNQRSKVLFGEHAADQVGEITKTFDCSKVLCIFDKGVKDVGIVDPIVESLEKARLKVVQYGEVLPDPPDTMVNECGELARKEEIEVIVGVGGGSTLDTAKGVNVLLGNPGKIEDYFLGPNTRPHKAAKPLVLLPTTSGTGSEITPMSVITHTAKNSKAGVTGPATVASYAIVDPLLAVAMPPHITAATGMDTFSHALEGYTHSMSNIWSELLAEKSMALVVQYLPRAVKNGSEIEARTNMSFACLLAGMSIDNGLHFGHAFAHFVGTTFHIAHGVGCAIAQPLVVEIAAGVMPEKIHRVGELMGLKLSENLSPIEVGARVSERIIALNKEIGIPTLKQLNIKESDLGPIAEGVYPTLSWRRGMPIELGKADVLRLVQKAYTQQS